MSGVRWVGFDEQYLSSYQEFARAHFGDRAYQAYPSYLDWLYCQNPHGARWREDFTLAIAENSRVVGCVHNLRLPWRIGNDVVSVRAIHNLMVSAEHRNGIGFLLLLNCFKGEKVALIPAATGPLADAYDKLRYQQIPSLWYRKVLRPLSSGLRLAANKVLHRDCPPRRFGSGETLSRPSRSDCRFEVAPSQQVTHEIAECLNGRYRHAIAPLWTAELVTWRFFHAGGPRHLLIYLDSGGMLEDFLILSLGPRRGLNVGRVIVAVSRSERKLQILAREAERAVQRSGGHVLLTYCADPDMNILMKALDWQKVSAPPRTYIYHRQRDVRFDNCSWMGFAGDFGFEAIEEAV